MKNENREEWLTKAVKKFEVELFKTHGYKVPKVKVSVGLPYGRGSKKAVAQHWKPAASADGLGSIFMSPTVDDGVVVIGTLIHEMVHAAVGNEAGHGPIFKKCALAVGLEGKMKSTTSTPGLIEKIKKLIKDIGPYPHARLDLGQRPTKKQSTRMLKVQCVHCGFVCRAAISKILLSGVPLCGCNHKPMEFEMPETSEADDL